MKPYYDKNGITIYCGEALAVLSQLPDESVDCCVTSPPFWGLRDYGHADQIGLEETPNAYVQRIVAVFEQVRRVLTNKGTLWLNLGDSYATGAGKVGECPGGGEQGERWKQRQDFYGGHRGSRGGSAKQPHTGASVGPMTQPNRLPIPGLKPKDLVGIPWRVAFALQESGWWLRQDIIWSKPNPMPESVTDRCTKAHEYIFLLAKSERYFFNHALILEPSAYADEAKYDNGLNGHSADVSHAGKGSSTRKFRKSGNKARKPASARGVPGNPGSSDGTTNGAVAGSVPWEGSDRNKRSVWTVTKNQFKGAHFATFPQKLIEPCILAGCPEGGVVLDPFLGSGTTAIVSQRLGCKCIGIELNEKYCEMAKKRLKQGVLPLAT